MKYSALYPIVAGLALGAIILPSTALAEKRTPFTATQSPSWLVSPEDIASDFVYEYESTLFIQSTESRVAGLGSYIMWAVDLNTEAPTYWGKLIINSQDGDWEGYWTGTKADGFMATLVGSGGYQGLVSRWTAPFPEGDSIEWSGYIVENGPGEVPLKLSGLRFEIDVPITDPAKPPFYVRASLEKGWGQISHIGVFSDVKELGLALMVFDPESQTPFPLQGRAMSIGKAANGDLFNCVSFGGMTTRGFEMQVFFAGGTGRFEHVVGSFAGQVEWTSDTSYTWNGTGKIRY